MPPAKTPSDVQFSGFYYPAILDAAMRAKRQFVPDHTETDPFDLVNGLIRVFALLEHQRAAQIDDGVAENFPGTAQTRAAMVQLCKLVGRHVRRETPAYCDVVATLTKLLSATEEIIPELARFSTTPISGITTDFEWTGDAVSVLPTDFDSATDASDRGIVMVYDSDLETYAIGVGANFWPNDERGDATYFGHPQLMFNELTIDLTNASFGAANNCRWEYYDDLYTFSPDTVTDLGSGALRLDLEGEFGPSGQKLNDTVFTVRVTFLPTGAYEDAVLEHDGAHYVETTYLGQTTASEVEGQYEIKPFWIGVEGLTDTTSGLKDPGTVTFTLPQTTTRRWVSTEVNDITAFWLRARAVYVASAVLTVSQLDSVSTPRRKWHILAQDCIQGRTVVEDLGTTTTDEFQIFPLRHRDVIEGSAAAAEAVSVGGDTEWSVVRSTYGYGPDDKIVMLDEAPDQTLRYVFGDGITGKIPAASETVIATYRTGASTDGNVGAGSVKVAATPMSALSDITNPRAASGWAEREGNTEAGLNRLRFSLPGFVRSVNGLVTAEGTGRVLEAEFITADGRAPIARAEGYEDATDPQTARVYVVGTGGTSIDSADLEEIEEWLNGVRKGWQKTDNRMVMNQEASVLNHVSRVVDVTTTVEILDGFDGGIQLAIKTALETLLGPLARKRLPTDDTIATGPYVWRIGGKVSKTTITATIAQAAGEGFVDQTTQMDDPGTPATDVSVIDLDAGELPDYGDIVVNITVVTSE